MTAQKMSTLRYEDQDWSVCEISGNPDSIPSSTQLGFETEMKSTANHSGRIDHYLVQDGKLLLWKIEVNLTNEHRAFVPDNGGRETLISEYWCQTLGGASELYKSAEVCLVYNELRIPLTGRIVLGRDFNQDLYVHMGTQTANRFNQRLILSFSGGSLDAGNIVRETGVTVDGLAADPSVQDKVERENAAKRAHWRSTLK